jgi:argonaute-like protein implicated in RNA metabolism and viral defense
MRFATFDVKVIEVNGEKSFIVPRANAMDITKTKDEKKDIFLDFNRIESLLIRSKVFPGIKMTLAELPENAKVSGRSTKRKTIQVALVADRK